jgi:D-3-phosphoglycerate dehydrogenase
MRIVIPDDYQDAARQVSSFGKLAGHSVTVYNDTTHDIDALAHRFGTADALLLIRARTRIRDELLARLPRLRLISQTGHAVDHIDVAACARRGVLVASGGGDATVATAELTWGLVLAASRHIALEAERLRAGRWQTTIGRVLAGRTLGILGYGRIGRAVAAYGDAFGMSVIVAGGREASRQSAEASGRRFVTDRRGFFATAERTRCVLAQPQQLSRQIAAKQGFESAAPKARSPNAWARVPHQAHFIARSAATSSGRMVHLNWPSPASS